MMVMLGLMVATVLEARQSSHLAVAPIFPVIPEIEQHAPETHGWDWRQPNNGGNWVNPVPHPEDAHMGHLDRAVPLVGNPVHHLLWNLWHQKPNPKPPNVDEHSHETEGWDWRNKNNGGNWVNPVPNPEDARMDHMKEAGNLPVAPLPFRVPFHIPKAYIPKVEEHSHQETDGWDWRNTNNGVNWVSPVAHQRDAQMEHLDLADTGSEYSYIS